MQEMSCKYAFHLSCLKPWQIVKIFMDLKTVDGEIWVPKEQRKTLCTIRTGFVVPTFLVFPIKPNHCSLF
ncbi:hypothetical protein Hdeb2414_s0012g00391101 [Helianthus debilis subsp. tardiflorus]